MTLSGFAFPFQISNGSVARAVDDEKVRQNLRHLLSTRLAERTMRRNYGGAVHHRLQATNDSTLKAVVRHQIEQALKTYFPEVRLTSPPYVEAREHELHVTIEYAADPNDITDRVELILT